MFAHEISHVNLLDTTEFSFQHLKIFRFCLGEVASKHLFEKKQSLLSIYQTWTIKGNGCSMKFENFVVGEVGVGKNIFQDAVSLKENSVQNCCNSQQSN